MEIDVHQVEYSDIKAMRSLFRHEAACRIVRDSILEPGAADPYLILVDGVYGGS